MERARIQEENKKLGYIKNISLLRVVTCRPGAECLKACYMSSLMALRQNIGKCHRSNTDFAREKTEEFFLSIYDQLKKSRADFFRWHVSGDIPSIDYYKCMLVIAETLPSCRFLCYTKRHDFLTKKHFVQANKLPNFSLVLSRWPGDNIPESLQGVPMAWLQGDARRPQNAFRCNTGMQCDACFRCWGMGHGDHLALAEHGIRKNQIHNAQH